MKNSITVEVVVNAPVEKVWECWNQPEHISGWAFADESWGAEAKSNDLKAGGKFVTKMFAKDGSASFEFGGTYTAVTENALIEYDMGDGRHVKTVFDTTPEGVKITQTFDAEDMNSEEKQRAGWQGILENFKKYVEGKK